MSSKIREPNHLDEKKWNNNHGSYLNWEAELLVALTSDDRQLNADGPYYATRKRQTRSLEAVTEHSNVQLKMWKTSMKDGQLLTGLLVLRSKQLEWQPRKHVNWTLICIMGQLQNCRLMKERWYKHGKITKVLRCRRWTSFERKCPCKSLQCVKSFSRCFINPSESWMRRSYLL